MAMMYYGSMRSKNWDNRANASETVVEQNLISVFALL